MSDIYAKVIEKSLEFRDASRENSRGLSSEADLQRLQNDPDFKKRTQRLGEITHELFELLDEIDVREGRVPKQ